MANVFANLIDTTMGPALAVTSSGANTSSTNISGCQTVSIQVVISAASGVSGGTATVQVSNDPTGSTPTNWIALTSPAAAAFTANGAYMLKGGDLQTPGFKHARVAFAASGGTYTATTTILGKGPTS